MPGGHFIRIQVTPSTAGSGLAVPPGINRRPLQPRPPCRVRRSRRSPECLRLLSPGPARSPHHHREPALVPRPPGPPAPAGICAILLLFARRLWYLPDYISAGYGEYAPLQHLKFAGGSECARPVPLLSLGRCLELLVRRWSVLVPDAAEGKPDVAPVAADRERSSGWKVPAAARGVQRRARSAPWRSPAGGRGLTCNAVFACLAAAARLKIHCCRAARSSPPRPACRDPG